VYDQAPAVFVLEGDGNPEPSSVRIRNISTTGFDVVPVEPDSRYTGVSDLPTTIHYLAITYGELEFPDGTTVEVSSVPITSYQAKNLSGDSWFNAGTDRGMSALVSAPTPCKLLPELSFTSFATPVQLGPSSW